MPARPPLQRRPRPGEVTLIEAARALRLSTQTCAMRATRQGWPRREAPQQGRLAYFIAAGLPAYVREALADLAAAFDPEAFATAAEIARALGVKVEAARYLARREEWPFERPGRQSAGLPGCGRPPLQFPLACLPRWVRIAVRDARSPVPDWMEIEPCARCGKRLPADALCECGRCGKSACAGCLAGEYCHSCRRESNRWRRRNGPRLRKAAKALAASRAARGEGVPA